MRVATVAESKVSLEAVHIEDIQLASSKMTGADRRGFQAEMTLKYCSGSCYVRRFPGSDGALHPENGQSERKRRA